jgi:hypothetical protein
MSSAISATVCFLFGRLLFGGCWTFSLEIDGGESFFLEGSCCFFGRFGCTILLLLKIKLLLKLYLHTIFSSGFNMQQTKLDKLQK